MSRDIWETTEIDKELLDGFLARFEKDAYRSNRTKFEDMEAEIHFKYTFERYAGEQKWAGKISVEVYDNYFQARGDEVLLDEYFREERIRELEF